ncbi:MAG: helix-turn-helix domain-containing protein [Chloroflexi bacterium]|nr:helix-turn-helix domain-containing protein [Chloroflexota bacterium]
MPDLAELGAALYPGAPRVAGPAGGPISWVRILRARVPAFDALESGDLAVVPAAALAVVAPGAEEIRALAEGCATAGVSGVVLVDGEVGAADGVAGEAGAADGAAGPAIGPATDRSRGDRSRADALSVDLERAGVPVLRLAAADLGELERSIIGYLVAQGAELERQAAALEHRLDRVALDGGGPTALVAAIAGFFGRAVALEGRRGDALAVHAPAELPDTALAAARYQARPRGPVALRVPLPAPSAPPGAAGRSAAGASSAAGAGPATPAVGASAAPAGSLVLLGDRPPSDLERLAVDRIVGLLALELSRDEAVRRARDAARRAEALPPGGPPWIVLLARQRVPGELDDTPAAYERREATRRELRLLAPARRLALRGDADSLEIRAVIAIDPPGGQDPEGHVIASRVGAFLARPVAISRPFDGVADRPAAEAEARAALEAAEAFPRAGPVVHATRLPVYRLLGAVHNLRDGERLARALLEPLLGGRPDVRREHLSTLRAILDGGGVAGAAGTLGVHRNTVAYRLARIEALTGWDLADPELRLALAVAVRFVQDP